MSVTKMATVSGKTEKGGFDCEFVEIPPEAVQSECPLCLQILCEPHQVSCCGYSFCKACIKRIKTDNKPCPTCNEETFVIFHNKGLQRSLYGFQVYCSHKQEGCEWKGELGQLDNHLNLSPQPDKQLEGCEYSEIECIYCSELIKRSRVTFHQTEHCYERPFSCEYCHSYKSTYKDVINNHWPVCGYHPVRCPNECGTFPQRQALENHVTKDCPETVIDCDFHHVGCNVKLPRKDMPAHLNENLVTHMSLQAASYKQLQEKVNKLESEALKQQPFRSHVSNETANQTTCIPILGYTEFTMDNYEQHKKDGDIWHSLPFFSRQGGYKFRLSVEANGYGDGKGTHLSVFTCLMKGAFDNHLKWPFRGRITLQLVDQEGGKKHHTITIYYTDKTPEGSAGRVVEGDKNKDWGRHKFISHDELEPKYLKNDCLCFHVTKIMLDNVF